MSMCSMFNILKQLRLVVASFFGYLVERLTLQHTDTRARNGFFECQSVDNIFLVPKYVKPFSDIKVNTLLRKTTLISIRFMI